MKLAIVLSTKQAETNWNAFRLGNLALRKGDAVSVFLVGEAVEYLSTSNEKFDVGKQVDTFLKSANAKIIACGTCLTIRNQKESRECPAGGIEDLYGLIINSDKVITF